MAKGTKKDTKKKNGEVEAVVRLPGAYPDYRVAPGERIVLPAIDANQSEGYERKRDVLDELEEQRLRIQDLQGKLYAENKHGLLIVLQAMDTDGKDGAIKHVFSGVNPQGCRVSSLRRPTLRSATTTFCGVTIRARPLWAASGFSTAPTTKTCSWSG